MSDYIETEGKTVEEAVEKALKALNLTEADVEIKVLEEGNKGILGIGKQSARVRVEPKNQLVTVAKKVATELLSLVFPNIVVAAKLVDDTVWLDVPAEAADFIGYHGQTLEALQFLLKTMVAKKLNQNVKIVVDIDGYRERRRQNLEALAEKTVSKVISSQEPVTLRPMPAFDRKVIHNVVNKYAGVKSESIGEEPERQVVIMPA